jgi:hypothetical protein
VAWVRAVAFPECAATRIGRSPHFRTALRRRARRMTSPPRNVPAPPEALVTPPKAPAARPEKGPWAAIRALRVRGVVALRPKISPPERNADASPAHLRWMPSTRGLPTIKRPLARIAFWNKSQLTPLTRTVSWDPAKVATHSATPALRDPDELEARLSFGGFEFCCS